MVTVQTSVPCICLRRFCCRDKPALVRHGNSATVAHYLRERSPHPFTAEEARYPRCTYDFFCLKYTIAKEGIVAGRGSGSACLRFCVKWAAHKCSRYNSPTTRR